MTDEDIDFLQATAMLLGSGNRAAIYQAAQTSAKELARIADEQAEINRFKAVVDKRVGKE